MKKCVFIYLLILGLSGCAERGDQAKASVYVSIEDFTHIYDPGSTKSLPIAVKTFGKKTWQGEVHLDLLQKDSSINHWQQSLSVAADTVFMSHIDIALPETEGVYHLQARILNFQDEPVLSRRLIEVKKPIRVQIN